MIAVIAPTSLFRKDARTLGVRWNDGSRSAYDLHALRSACPCAACVNEWTGARILDASKVPADVRPARLFSVGRYAVGVQWSDGHATGIFSYDYLRRLDEKHP
jgi:DUF971 family protein